MATTTAALLEAFPSMAHDADLMPLMQRMAVIERLLQTNIETLKDPTITHADLVRLHKQQEGLLANAREITAKLESIGWERIMNRSLQKIEQGMTRLGIRRS